MPDDLDDFEAEFKKALQEAHEEWMGNHKEHLGKLLSLSKAEIDSITPDQTDLEEYNKLVAVVRKASAKNLSNAALYSRITQLGKTAISIARKAGIPIPS